MDNRVAETRDNCRRVVWTVVVQWPDLGSRGASWRIKCGPAMIREDEKKTVVGPRWKDYVRGEARSEGGYEVVTPPAAARLRCQKAAEEVGLIEGL